MPQSTLQPERDSDPRPLPSIRPAYRREAATPFSAQALPPPPPPPVGHPGGRVYYAGTSRKVHGLGKALGLTLAVLLVFMGGKFALDRVIGSDQGRLTAAEQAEKLGNGQLPADQLAPISPDHSLVAAAAKQFAALQQAFSSAGYSMTINSAYRTIAEQEELVAKLGLLEDGGKAAPVGTSEHGLGLSVDLTLDFEALQWMNENAGRFGFERTIDDEPWHWTFVR